MIFLDIRKDQRVVREKGNKKQKRGSRQDKRRYIKREGEEKKIDREKRRSREIGKDKKR